MTPKRMLCIRHGESTFNAIASHSRVDPLHYDARLSELGEQQVRGAREMLRHRRVDLVVTSPLTRALQTTAGIFADHPFSPRILVEALHRERLESSCDIGRSPSTLQDEFPSFAFDHLPDVWWHHHDRPDDRGVCVEPAELVQSRAREFRRFLLQRPEALIAVVGHGTFFFNLIGQKLANCEVVEVALG